MNPPDFAGKVVPARPRKTKGGIGGCNSLHFYDNTLQFSTSVTRGPTRKIRLLAVSREPLSLKPLWSAVEANGWNLEVAGSVWDAIERVQMAFPPQLLVFDLPKEEHDSFHILRWFRRLRPELSIVVLSYAEDSAKHAEFLRLGAMDFLTRPITEQRFEEAIRRGLRRSNHSADPVFAGENIEQLGDDVLFVGTTPVMHHVRAQVELLAQTNVPVLICGETGSGRETIARLIHKLSVRSEFRFTKVNCSVLPGDLIDKEVFGNQGDGVVDDSEHGSGLFERCDNGTVFFQEVGNLPQYLQKKLLHVLQARSSIESADERQFDIRILATTGENVERAVWKNTLHEDLYCCLSAFTVHVPSLRQRKDEIPILLRYFMHKLAKHYNLPPRNLSSAVLEASQRYSWPGNLRELESFVKRYLIIGEMDVTMGWSDASRTNNLSSSAAIARTIRTVKKDAADVSTAAPMSLKSIVKNVKSEAERNAIAAALEKTGWNRKAAARLLRVSYRTMLYKIVEYNMTLPETYSQTDH